MVQFEDLRKMREPEEPHKSERSSLLRKFDIPLHHLEFSYIETCTNGKELEKILQILRSGEEGYYPDLTKAAELRLTEIKPNSRYIRKLTPVLSKESIDKREMIEISDDLSKWLDDIVKSNEELQTHRDYATKSLPQIRKSSEVKPEAKSRVDKRIKSTDYASWDKYDADTAILKMELAEEKLKNDVMKTDPFKTKKIKFNRFTTRVESIFEANRWKEKGNECFKAGEYEDALEYYSTSMECFPSSTLYTNRAITHIKLKQYQEAISDCHEAFKYDPDNLKAHLRLSQSYEALEKLPQALHHAEKVIEIDPNNDIAQKIAEKARQRAGTQVPHIRFKIKEVDDNVVKSPKKSILKKASNLEIIPIPGTSKMKSPFYKAVYSEDPEVITKEQQKINSRPQALYLMNIDIPSDEDGDCVENHLATKPAQNEPLKDTKDSQRYRTEIIEKRPRSKVEIEDGRHSKSRKQNQTAPDEERDKFIANLKAPNGINNKSTTTKGGQEISFEVNRENQHKQVVIEELEENAANSKPMTGANVESSKGGGNDFVNNQRRRDDQRGVGNNLGTGNSDIRGGGEPHIQETGAERIPLQIHLPYTFLQSWQSVRKDQTYLGFASILRNVSMDRITQVIGNKLDGTILSDIINCLYCHFTVASEVEKVYSALVNLCRLERFAIVAMFLSNEDKQVVQNLIDFLRQHGHYLPQNVIQQYGFKS